MQQLMLYPVTSQALRVEGIETIYLSSQGTKRVLGIIAHTCSCTEEYK